MKNTEKIFCIFNNNQKSVVIFAKEFDLKKEKNKYNKEIMYNLAETDCFTQGDLLLFFLTADFEAEKSAERTFFKHFKNKLKEKIKSKSTVQELAEFQKKYKNVVNFVFNYEINDRGYDIKFKDHMRNSSDYMSLRYLRSEVEVLFDVGIAEEKDNYEKNLVQTSLEYSNDIYIVDTLQSLLYMLLKEYVTVENLPVRKCKNCGEYFIAQKRKDELYCQRIYKDTNKSCKQIGSSIVYVEKLDNDPALLLYRNMSKRKYMRASRNIENNEIQEEYEQWKEKAKNKYEEYKNDKITTSEFLKWLQENEN